MFGNGPLVPARTLTLTAYLHEKYAASLAEAKKAALEGFAKNPPPLKPMKAGRSVGKSTAVARWAKEAEAERQKKLAEGLAAIEKAHKPSLKKFLAFAEDFMTKHPARNPTYLEVGIGVQLEDGTVVALGPAQAQRGMRDEGLYITPPKVVPGLNGVVPTYSQPITRG